MRFSDRYGITSVKEVFQLDCMNSELRNALWSVMYLHICSDAQAEPHRPGPPRYPLSMNPKLQRFCRRLWLQNYKEPVDTIPGNWAFVLERLRAEFLSCYWHEAYNFLEFVANNYDVFDQDKFIAACNAALKVENSAYRLVNCLITRVTDEEEINAIENASQSALAPVRAHLRRALELLSSREQPDYRNSIKESISAVESLVCNVLGEKGTLGELIKKLQNEIGLHPALSGALNKLYGYTSDEDGVRHAILDSDTVGLEDAKFFLVTCSAFINFVTAKLAGLSK
jgi:hypothetical protein